MSSTASSTPKPTAAIDDEVAALEQDNDGPVIGSFAAHGQRRSSEAMQSCSVTPQ